MEASSEVRQLHVIYFLSRNGCIEHPHLVRIYHQTRNGVKLRDIKRWLGELRGNDMPGSFSWSYKRKYKTGYVWQDLLDDDLINPISDNEYVLKGSEIINSCSSGECDGRTPHQKHQHPVATQPLHSRSSVSTSEIEEESPTVNSETSTVIDDSVAKVDYQTDKNEKRSNSNRNRTGNALDKNVTTTVSAADGSKSHKKGGSSSSSNAFRNLITCGGLETNDPAQVVRLNKHEKNNDKRSFLKNIRSSTDGGGFEALSKGDSRGGSQRAFGNPTWTQPPNCNARKSFDYSSSSRKGKSDEQRDKKAPTAAYYPINGPTCSQCGKAFKPQKLHSHMNSCKGMKALSSKAATVSDKA